MKQHLSLFLLMIPCAAIGLAASATGAPAVISPVSLPLTPAGAPNSAPMLPSQTIPSLSALSVPLKPKTSMGNAGVSIFFSSVQVSAIESALLDYESRPGSANATRNLNDSDLLLSQEAPKLTEPPIYPVFYLSSIAFNSPDDWSIWVSGHKITSSKNDTDLTVLEVTANSVKFSWTSNFKEALALRKENNSFAPIDKVKNKLSQLGAFTYDQDAGSITFTLTPNQSFNVAYMNQFEGFIESPALPPLPSTQLVAASAITAAGSGQSPSPAPPFPGINPASPASPPVARPAAQP